MKAQKAKSQCLKEQLLTTYSKLDSEVKKRARTDKKAFMDKLADEVEEGAQKQDMATLYKITKSLAATVAGGFKNNDVPVMDSDRNVITGRVEQMQGWKYHFQCVHNREAPNIHGNISENDNDQEEDTNPRSLMKLKMQSATLNHCIYKC